MRDWSICHAAWMVSILPWYVASIGTGLLWWDRILLLKSLSSRNLHLSMSERASPKATYLSPWVAGYHFRDVHIYWLKITKCNSFGCASFQLPFLGFQILVRIDQNPMAITIFYLLFLKVELMRNFVCFLIQIFLWLYDTILFDIIMSSYS